jgi:FkbM family methyltransferase
MEIPPRLRNRLEPLPFPVRFSDGATHLSTVRLALLRRFWRVMPGSEEESRQALDAYPGGDLLDIGAFHGWYSVLLAPKAAAGDRFVSFEPNPDALPALRSVLGDVGRHYPSVQMSVVAEPVGDGRAVSVTWPMGAEGHPRFGGGDAGGAVTSLTIDEFVQEHGLAPGLVKIDVEGAELSVLHGMRHTMAQHRPVLLLEIHPDWQPDGVNAADVEAFVRDAGYDGSTFDDTHSSRRQLWLPRVVAPSRA